MRFAVFISSGIGNALLLVPLIKELNKKGNVTAISTSPFGASEIFDGFETSLFKDIIILDSSIEWIRHAQLFRKKFDAIFLDYFAATRANIVLSHLISKRIVTNQVPRKLPKTFASKIDFKPPLKDIHEAVQYLRFEVPNFPEDQLSEEHFSVTAANPSSKANYITLQLGSGNNIAPWKTLPLPIWLEVMEKILATYPDVQIKLIGDESEQEISDQINSNERIENLIGKTQLAELPGIVSGAKAHIGNDSMMLHLAGCLGIPTLTIWGGSDPVHYGWQEINTRKHFIIHHKLDCHPCSRWIAPNISKTETPSMCADFKCLNLITASEIMKAVEKHLSLG